MTKFYLPRDGELDGDRTLFINLPRASVGTIFFFVFSFVEDEDTTLEMILNYI